VQDARVTLASNNNVEAKRLGINKALWARTAGLPDGNVILST